MSKTLVGKITLIVVVFVLLQLVACQPALTPLPPTATPLPSATPTVTPLPVPQEMDVDEMIQNCANLDLRDIPVILQGKVFLPDSTIYGYEGWYGVDFITTSRTRVLFGIGGAVDQMEELPQFFHEQDLVIHDANNRLIRHGHEVRVTGRARYREDNENRRCELFVDKVETLMPDGVLEPIDLTVAELVDGNNVNDCPELSFSRQFVRLQGLLRVDDYLSLCQLGQCKVIFADSTGDLAAYILEGESKNRMKTLHENFSDQDLIVFDTKGTIVDNSDVSLVGVVEVADEAPLICELIVYEVEGVKE